MSLRNIRNMDYVVLLCKDVVVMREFYQNVLGLNIDLDECEEDWVQFRVGSNLLCLRPHGRCYDGIHSGEGASTQLSFRLSPDGVNTAYEELCEHSVEIIEPPTDQSFGHRTIFFKDPEGNILEVYAEI